MASVPGSGKSSGGEHGNPFQYSCLEYPTDRGAYRVTKNGTRLKWLSSTHTPLKHKIKIFNIKQLTNIILKSFSGSFPKSSWRISCFVLLSINFFCIKSWFSWGSELQLPLDFGVCIVGNTVVPFLSNSHVSLHDFHEHVLLVAWIQDSSLEDCPQDLGYILPSCTEGLELMFIQDQLLESIGINYTLAFHAGKHWRHTFLDSSWNITQPKIIFLLVFLPIPVFLSGFS